VALQGIEAVSNPRRPLRALALALLVAAPVAAQALHPDADTGMQVRGIVDLDNFSGPVPPLSEKEQSVSALPLPVSQIDVSDSAPGVYLYRASADIGLLELKTYGSVTNGTAAGLGNGESTLMFVQSEVRDVLTLNAATTDPYTVTFELDVDGVVTGSGSARANAFLDFGLLGGVSHANDSGSWSFGLIDDTLSVARQVSGTTVQMDFTARLSFDVTRIDPGSTVTGALDNTATMRLILPPGVSLASSASGTFGVPIPAIPEPATGALMLAGLAALGSLAQRRRASPT
jgi:hypothetical protein